MGHIGGKGEKVNKAEQMTLGIGVCSFDFWSV